MTVDTVIKEGTVGFIGWQVGMPSMTRGSTSMSVCSHSRCSLLVRRNAGISLTRGERMMLYRLIKLDRP